QAVVAIRDSGIGIEPAQLDRIFATFYQSDRSLDRTFGGLGLGLALVKGLVELHGGTVVARSTGMNQGSEFVVQIPLCSAPAEVPDQKAARPSARRYRILVIDDQRDALYTMNKLLAKLGHEVITAQNGEEALQAAARFHPEVIFSDIGLPGMD